MNVVNILYNHNLKSTQFIQEIIKFLSNSDCCIPEVYPTVSSSTEVQYTSLRPTISSPPEVTTNVPLGVEPSSNYLSVNGNATPGDRGEGCDGSSIMGMMEDGAKDVLDVTSSGIPVSDLRELEGEVNREAVCKTTSGGTASGMKSRIGPQVEPAADLREAEGELNKRAVCKTKRGGEDVIRPRVEPESDLRELEGEVNREGHHGEWKTSGGEADGRTKRRGLDIEWNKVVSSYGRTSSGYNGKYVTSVVIDDVNPHPRIYYIHPSDVCRILMLMNKFDIVDQDFYELILMYISIINDKYINKCNIDELLSLISIIPNVNNKFKGKFINYISNILLKHLIQFNTPYRIKCLFNILVNIDFRHLPLNLLTSNIWILSHGYSNLPSIIKLILNDLNVNTILNIIITYSLILYPSNSTINKLIDESLHLVINNFHIPSLINNNLKLSNHNILTSPPEVQSNSVPLAVEASPNYLSLKSRATPRDRGGEGSDEGCDGSSIMGMMEDGAKDVLDVTSSELPESDLRELEGEVNGRADGRTKRGDKTSGGKDSDLKSIITIDEYDRYVYDTSKRANYKYLKRGDSGCRSYKSLDRIVKYKIDVGSIDNMILNSSRINNNESLSIIRNIYKSLYIYYYLTIENNSLRFLSLKTLEMLINFIKLYEIYLPILTTKFDTIDQDYTLYNIINNDNKKFKN